MMFTEQTKSKQKGELNMTFGELLKVVDKSTRIQVCINMYGLDFKQAQQENTSDTVYRDVFELVPSKENFYGTDPDRLQGLKNSIQLFGVMQDVLIEDVNGEDHIISGHCRTMCCRMLVEEGHEEFRKINCKYTTVKDDTRKMLLEDGEEDHETTQLLEKLAVIQANRFREKTDWEKMKEALETEEIIKGLRERTASQ